jgi:hypothetical protein
MSKSEQEQVFIGIDDQVIELTGADKQAYLADRKAMADAQALLSPEQAAKAAARESALAKLADLGLTAEEIAAL